MILNKVRDSEEEVSRLDNEPQLIGQAKSPMNDLLEITVKLNSTLTLDERVKMLNVDHKRVFDRVGTHLIHQQ